MGSKALWVVNDGGDRPQTYRAIEESLSVSMMAAYSGEDLVREGVLGYLYKPFEPAECLAAVARAKNHKQKDRR